MICVLIKVILIAEEPCTDIPYSCVIAGFKPTKEILYKEIKMKDLLYIGGLRAYLQHRR